MKNNFSEISEQNDFNMLECPLCGSHDFEDYDIIRNSDGSLTVFSECRCGASWSENFVFENICTIKKKGEEDV